MTKATGKSIDYKELLPLITEDIIIDIMAENGSPVYGDGETSDGQRYLMFQTICHHGDSHKLYYYTETKTFHCYTNCGTMSVFDLVKRVRNYNDNEFWQCVQYVAQKGGYSINSRRTGIGDNALSRRRVMRYTDSLEELARLKNKNNIKTEIRQFYDPKILELFDANTFYQGWLDEGMSFETLHKYNIRYYWGENHIIIPHVDFDGNLVGIRRRSLNPEDSNNKYMPEYIGGKFYEHSLGLNLYGLYQNKQAIERAKTAIIFEGEKSVLLSDTYYGNKSIAVATCGFNISEWQINALVCLGVETVFIAFDKDFDIKHKNKYNEDDYLAYRKRLCNLAGKMLNNFTVRVILDKKGLLKEKDSPIDRGKETFEILLKSAKISRESELI